MEFKLQQWRKWKTRGQLLFLKRPTMTQCKSLLSPLLIPGMPLVNWELPVWFQEKICFEECNCCWRWARFARKHRAPKESRLWKPSGNTFYWVKDKMCRRMSRSTENIIMCGMSKRFMVNFRGHHSTHTQKTQHADSYTMCSVFIKLLLTCALICRYWVLFLSCEHIH